MTRSNRKVWVEGLLQKKTAKHEAKLYKFSVNSNHLHLLMKFPSAAALGNFLRDLSGSLALKIKRHFRIAKETSIWDGRPFSRLLTQGAFPFLIKYIERNRNEATGFWEYKPRSVSELIRNLERLSLRGKKNFATVNDCPAIST